MTDLSSERISELAEKWLNGTISEEEKRIIERWYNESETSEALYQDTDQWELREYIFRSIQQKISPQKEQSSLIRSIAFKYWAAAAVILLALTGGAYFFLSRPANQPALQITKKEIVEKDKYAPGRDKAILTLGDGTVIDLDTVRNGYVTSHGNTIVAQGNGRLVYNAGAPASSITYNTISTPRGGQYQVVLADGTQVWLNAEFSIHFPTSFIGNERKVHITGEAYLEVVKNERKPFRVETGDMSIEVLGTQFNVNSYFNEPSMKTTLLEGRVKIKTGTAEKILRPGEQAEVFSGKLQVNTDVNLERVTAWKTGVFDFQDANLRSIMRQLSRWYDVEIVYEKNVPDLKFWGSIQRSLKLSDVLEILGKMDVNFKIEGQKIIVMP